MKVVISWSIKVVDFVAVSFTSDQSSLDAAATLNLLRLEIGDGVAILDPAKTRDVLGIEDQGFAERRLPGAAVRQQNHVSDVSHIYVGHLASPFGLGYQYAG